MWKVIGASLLTTVGTLPVFLLATQSVPLRRELGFGEQRSGVAVAACRLTANLAMARSIPAHRRGLGFGVKQSATPVAIILAGLAVPTMTTQLGWRSTFWVVGVVGAVVVVTGLFSRTRGHPLRSPGGLLQASVVRGRITTRADVTSSQAVNRLRAGACACALAMALSS